MDGREAGPVVPVIALDDVPRVVQRHGETFEAAMGQIGPLLGAQKLGCRLTVVPPGKKAWPYHAHHANEELFVVLAGRGTLRYGGRTFAITQGDVILCRSGGADTAHQILNDSDAELRYLAISTMNEPDIMEYPDSGKFVAFAGAAPGGDKADRRFAHIGRRRDAVDYFDGEI